MKNNQYIEWIGENSFAVKQEKLGCCITTLFEGTKDDCIKFINNYIQYSKKDLISWGRFSKETEGLWSSEAKRFREWSRK